LQIYNNRLYNIEFSFVKVCIHFFLANPVYDDKTGLSQETDIHVTRRHLNPQSQPADRRRPAL